MRWRRHPEASASTESQILIGAQPQRTTGMHRTALHHIDLALFSRAACTCLMLPFNVLPLLMSFCEDSMYGYCRQLMSRCPVVQHGCGFERAAAPTEAAEPSASILLPCCVR